MLTHEEALICCIELHKRGYRHLVYWGSDRHGYHVRFCWVHPLSAAGARHKLHQIDRPDQLAPYLTGAGDR